jgi:hypothetical protein
MLRIEKGQAPSFAALRPFRPPTTPEAFPVYDDLDEQLVSAPAPDELVAHVLAVAAGYAYAGPDVLAMMLARLGLEDCRCQAVSMSVDPMFIRSTANVVQSADGRVVIVAYRGTEPMSFINWLTDADVYQEQVRLAVVDAQRLTVHAGFYRNVRATRYQVLGMLERAINGRSVLDDDAPVDHPMEALYITGHSLGGAMASLLAVMLQTDDSFEVLAERMRAVCTYGQPMIGGPALASMCQGHGFLGSRLVRYVYGKDVVPHLPPRDTGEFRHFGRQRRFDGSTWQAGHDTPQMATVAGLLETPASFLAQRLPVLRRLPHRYSLDDHLPHHYIKALTPADKPSEFGDAPYDQAPS